MHTCAQCDHVPLAKPWPRDLEVQGECKSQWKSSKSAEIFHGSPGLVMASESC